MGNKTANRTMRILMLGDVVGSVGCRCVRHLLPNLKQLYHVDVVIANGENSADGNGVTPASLRYLQDSGVDVVTTGNHAFRRKESYELFDTWDTLLRPCNYPKGAPGKGVCLLDLGRVQVGVVNVMGTSYLDPLDNPFTAMEQLLPELPKICVVDFHAEATGEKAAMAYFLDGKVSAVFGTHTHVQTADAQILEHGTAFLTDVGMTGPIRSILGVKPEIIVEKLRTHMPARFDLADGPCHLDGVLLTVEEKTGKAVAVEAIRIEE